MDRLLWWRRTAGMPRELWILLFSTFINRAGVMAVPFLVLYLNQELRLPAARAGLALLVYGAASFVVAPLAGVLSDRMGALRLMRWSLGCSGCLLLLIPLARSEALVMALVALWGFTGEALRPANMAMVAAVAPVEHRRAAFALNRLAINLGMSIGPAVGGFVAAWSFPMIFIVDGLSSLVAAAVLIFGMRARTSTASVDRAPHQLAALRDARLRHLLLVVMLVMLPFFQHIGAMPLFMTRELGQAESVYGLMFTLNTALIILFEMPLTLAMEHWTPRVAIALGTALIGVGFGGMALASGAWGVAAAVVVWTIGEMVLFPAGSSYVADLAPQGRQGQYMGLYTMAGQFAFMTGPWLGVWVLERFGSTVIWAGCLVMALVAAAVMLAARFEDEPKRLEQAAG